MYRLRPLRRSAAVGAVVLAAGLLGAAPAAADATNVPPTLDKPTVSDAKATLNWTDNSSNEAGFVAEVLKGGNWATVYDIATRNQGGTGGRYTWTDSAPLTVSEGERCYRVVLSHTADLYAEGISTEWCVSAPAPASGPASPKNSAAAKPGQTTAGAAHTTKAAAPSNPAGASTNALPGGGGVAPGDSAAAPVAGPAPAVRAAPAVAGYAGRFSKAPLAVRVAVVLLGCVLILGLGLVLWLSLQQSRRRSR
jgi:hypothetical protein